MRDAPRHVAAVSRIVDGCVGPLIISSADAFVVHARHADDPASALAFIERAIERDPEHIEAHLFAATKVESFHQRMHHLQIAVEAGDRIWIPYARGRGDDMVWWDHIGTHPYMKAIRALGDCHAEVGNVQAARWCYERLLRMNPDDDQDVTASLEQLDNASSFRMR